MLFSCVIAVYVEGLGGYLAGVQGGEQVAVVYPFALVQGVVNCVGFYGGLGLGQLPGRVVEEVVYFGVSVGRGGSYEGEVGGLDSKHDGLAVSHEDDVA